MLFNYFQQLTVYHASISYAALALREGKDSPQAWPATANGWSYSGNPLVHPHSLHHIPVCDSFEVSEDSKDSAEGTEPQVSIYSVDIYSEQRI